MTDPKPILADARRVGSSLTGVYVVEPEVGPVAGYNGEADPEGGAHGYSKDDDRNA